METPQAAAIFERHHLAVYRFLRDLATDGRQTDALTLQEALDSLRGDEREAFLLREVAGLGYEEIGPIVEATPDAVRMRIYRARTALRAWLGGAGGTRAPKETVR